MLSRLGYEVILASNGRDALARFAQHRERIGVVVLDVAMPVMSGAECCHELRRLDPDVPVILASGFPKGHDLQPLLSLPNTRYVRKPYELDDLAANLAELTGEVRASVRPSSRAVANGN
jgi:CheY-like chemotaxis protein